MNTLHQRIAQVWEGRRQKAYVSVTNVEVDHLRLVYNQNPNPWEHIRREEAEDGYGIILVMKGWENGSLSGEKEWGDEMERTACLELVVRYVS